MFTPSAMLSAFIYVAGLVPYRLLAYCPFRGHLRFPLWFVLFIQAINTALQFFLCCHCCSNGIDIRPCDIWIAILTIAAYLLCVKVEISKLLFIYVLIMDYVSITRGIAIFVQIRFFMKPGASCFPLGTFSDLVICTIIIAITAPFMIAFFNATKDRILYSHAPQLWRTIWLVPAYTSIIVLAFTWNLNMVTVAGLAFLLARVCLLIMVFIVYYILVTSLESLKLQGEAEERARNQEQLINFQRAQYSMLQKQIEETRQARHDLRQHLNLIQTYLEKGNEDLLKSYIEKYGQKILSLSPRTYCSNYAIDAVVRHYAEMALENNIRFDSHIQLPRELSIDEPDICILFGNLLENAVDSCIAQPGTSPFVRVHARIAGERAISITVDNACPVPPVMKDGHYVSSKHSGHGTGITSIRNIAAQHNGIADFKYESQVFYASVFLNPRL